MNKSLTSHSRIIVRWIIALNIVLTRLLARKQIPVVEVLKLKGRTGQSNEEILFLNNFP